MLRIYRKKNHFVLVINGEPSFLLSESELALILRRIAAQRPGSLAQTNPGLLRLPVCNRGDPRVILNRQDESTCRILQDFLGNRDQDNEQSNSC